MGKFASRLLAFAGLAASAAVTSGPVEATPAAPASAAHVLPLVEPAQFIHLGRPYCWYPYGWAGAGWYRCGYGTQTGFGWGGPFGWNGWVVPRRYRTAPGYRYRPSY